MKFETKTEEDGTVILKLGLAHEAAFEKGVDMEAIVVGVETLVKATVGVSVMDLAIAVVKEFNKDG